MKTENYQALLLSFDGDYQREGDFESIEDGWEYIADLGSKWFFYPFAFICKGETIKDVPEGLLGILLEKFKNKRINTLRTIFKKANDKAIKDNAINMDVIDYGFYIAKNFKI